MEQEIEDLKSRLLSLVRGNSLQVTVQTLMKDYLSHMRQPMPLARFGYTEPVKFLKERCSDCFLLQGDCFNPVVIIKDTNVQGKSKKTSPARVQPPPGRKITCKTVTINRREKIKLLIQKLNKKPESLKRSFEPAREKRKSNGSISKETKLYILKRNIINILKDNPNGILCSNLSRMYRDWYSSELVAAQFGHNSIEELVRALEDAVCMWCPLGKDDWVLLPFGAICKRRSSDHLKPFVDASLAIPNKNVIGIALSSLNDLCAGAVLKVAISEVYSPSHIWLIRTGEEQSRAVSRVMTEMSNFYNRDGGICLSLNCDELVVGQYCGSRHQREWFRSVIVKIIDTQKVKVRQVDFGTLECCAVDDLKPLRHKWCKMPQQAIRARLSGVRPPAAARRWPHCSATYLREAILNQYFNATLTANQGGILEVSLAHKSGSNSDKQVSINTKMIREGYADVQKGSSSGASKSYLYPSFEALELGKTPTYSEIRSHLREDIEIDYMDEYHRHVPSCLPRLCPA